MSDLRNIPIDDLRRRPDARIYGENEVAALAGSISDIGLLNPPTVRPLPSGGFEVIAGSHRLAACDSLGWPEIPCRVLDLDETRAKLAMIDENLVRAELVGIERDRQVAERKAIYETLHPETRRDATLMRGQNLPSRQLGETGIVDRFTAETAALTGQSERTIQRSAERGAKVTPEAAAVISGTRLDTGAYADRIKSLPGDQQAETARRDLAEPPRLRSSPQATPEPCISPQPKAVIGEAFARFVDLVQQIEDIGVRDLLASVKGIAPQRAQLGQRAASLSDFLDDVTMGLSR